MRNIFADKASLILRKILISPDEKWVVRDFTGEGGVSIGLAQEVLETLEKKGYAERVKTGPNSYTLLTNPDKLIEAWLLNYQFEFNEVYSYYSSETKPHNSIKEYFQGENYALTLHSGANLITPYVNTEHIHLYLDPKMLNAKNILKFRQDLNLKELKSGGNVHIIKPYYKNSVFTNIQAIKGYKIVSDLQLYLDLYNFHPRGREHAEYLKKLIEEKGSHLA